MSISSIDTSQYTTPLSTAFYTGNNEHPLAVKPHEAEQLPNAAAVEDTTPKVDVSSYYSNVAAPDLHDNGNQAAMSIAAQNLNERISQAVTNGMDLQDAINIRNAKTAYESSVTMAKSTLEVEV